MKLTEASDVSRCCCSCRHNVRSIHSVYGCICHCDKGGHYIGYVANFTQTCEEWEEDNE